MSDFLESLEELIQGSAPEGWTVTLSRNGYTGTWVYYRYAARINRLVYISADLDDPDVLIDIQIEALAEDDRDAVSRRTIFCGDIEPRSYKELAEPLHRAFEEVESLNPSD